jgi:hypothetical protein
LYKRPGRVRVVCVFKETEFFTKTRFLVEP